MSFSRSVIIVIAFACLLSSAFGQMSARPSHSSSQESALLPQAFGGWEMLGTPQTSTDPAAADPTNAAVLKEYRFSDLAASAYTRDDGRTLKIRAARFADASGAFGAYTFYLQPAMTKEQIGDKQLSSTPPAFFFAGLWLSM